MARYRTKPQVTKQTLDEKLYTKLLDGKINIEQFLNQLDNYSNRSIASKAAYWAAHGIKEEKVKLPYTTDVVDSLIEVLVEYIYETGNQAIKLVWSIPEKYWDHEKIYNASKIDKLAIPNAIRMVVEGRLKGSLRPLILNAIKYFDSNDSFHRSLYNAVEYAFKSNMLTYEEREECFLAVLGNTTFSYWLVVSTEVPRPLTREEQIRIIEKYDDRLFDWVEYWNKGLSDFVRKIKPIKDLLPEWVVDKLANRALRAYKVKNMKAVLENLDIPEDIADRITAKVVMKTLTQGL
jgi:hypothetical protein